MKKAVSFLLVAILTVFTLISCEPWSFSNLNIDEYEVVWEGEEGGSILLGHIVFDSLIVYQFQSKKYYLAGISFDASEVLTVMEVSPDETHLVLLSNSRRYPKGTCLLVFNLSILPDGDEFEPLLDVTNPKVLDATIDNEEVDYLTPVGWMKYPF